MKKQILNLGKALNKTEQKIINGGGPGGCSTHQDCEPGHGCCNPDQIPNDGVCVPANAWCDGDV